MHYGPAHIVWEDENFARHHVGQCLENFDKYRAEDCTDTEHQAVKDSLLALLELSDEVLEPIDDDNCHSDPDAYPPPAGMIMRRV